jgi:hypothetical protein
MYRYQPKADLFQPRLIHPRTSADVRKATSAKKLVLSAAATPEEPPSQPEIREGKAKAELRGEGSRAARWIGARARRARERL